MNERTNSGRRPRSATERSSQPVGVDSPKIVLLSVHEDDGDLFSVLLEEVRVSRDVDLVDGFPEIGAHRVDHCPRVVAEVATRLGEQAHAMAHASEFDIAKLGDRTSRQ